MLIQFSVRNFKTFKDKVILSFVASNYDKDTRELENISCDDKFNLRILRSSVIYGANASGKSKFFDALRFMRRFVINSSRDTQKGDGIDVDPFRLNEITENAPSEFEVIFIHKNTMYRYGFEVDRERVISEWLFYKPKTKEIELFYRDFQQFELHPRNFTKGNALVKEKLVRDDALLVSVAAQFNDSVCIAVIDWFRKFKIISGLREEGYQGYTMNKTENSSYKTQILNLLKAADLGIQDIRLHKDADGLPENMPKEVKEKIIREIAEENAEFIFDVLTTHKKYNDSKLSSGFTTFSLNSDESSGTRKFFALTGPILDVLENGYTLMIDELDSKLHPNLVCKIVSLFNSKELNRKNAQLIFNTHDTNLLGSGLFRRDQIWFVNKNKYGEAILYSLADFKSEEVRKAEDFEGNYIQGKYGAIPFLDYFNDLFKSLANDENEE